jgi:hypothetical protein
MRAGTANGSKENGLNIPNFSPSTVDDGRIILRQGVSHRNANGDALPDAHMHAPFA